LLRRRIWAHGTVPLAGHLSGRLADLERDRGSDRGATWFRRDWCQLIAKWFELGAFPVAQQDAQFARARQPAPQGVGGGAVAVVGQRLRISCRVSTVAAWPTSVRRASRAGAKAAASWSLSARTA
jgi:hypothetical protein